MNYFWEIWKLRFTGSHHFDFEKSLIYLIVIFYCCRSYPVYAVGDYASGGQQYYTTSSGNYSANGNENGTSGQSYIVPVDGGILNSTQSRESPQTISAVS